MPIAVNFTAIFVCMTRLILTVWKQDRRVSRYSMRWNHRHTRNTKLSFIRACLYIGSYLLTAVPVTTLLVMDDTIGGAYIPFGWVLLANMTMPM